ncbi:MAG TPA: hypothetical protein DIT49_03030 [Clostridiales bacterium]|nr:hypothetical protein [Clostridiales bacterium]
MAELHMLSYKLQDLQFFNKLDKPGQVQLESTFNFSVNYNQDGTRCIAKLYQGAKDKSEGPDHKFFVSVEVLGVFQIDGGLTDEDKKAFHVQCYQQLFPYADQFTRQVCAAGGMPGFMLVRQKMSPDKVVINKKG